MEDGRGQKAVADSHKAIWKPGLNRDLAKISLWAWQWKMQFNDDKTGGVVFSCKRNKQIHAGLTLGEELIVSNWNTSTLEHKWLFLSQS